MIIFSEKGNFSQGALITINKPINWTSFDVVNKIRHKLKYQLNLEIKIGHSGTLDPLATGLLIICTGKYTKQISTFQKYEKEYIAELQLGAATPSLDKETKINQTFPTQHINSRLILNILPSFIGNIEQIPPSYSAVKVEGKRAYRLARSGKNVKLKSKKVFIRTLELIEYKNNKLILKIICSKGTYIRSLARDLGSAFNSAAYLTSLKRTRIGNFSIKDAFDIEKCMQIIENFH